MLLAEVSRQHPWPRWRTGDTADGSARARIIKNIAVLQLCAYVRPLDIVSRQPLGLVGAPGNRRLSRACISNNDYYQSTWETHTSDVAASVPQSSPFTKLATSSSFFF